MGFTDNVPRYATKRRTGVEGFQARLASALVAGGVTSCIAIRGMDSS